MAATCAVCGTHRITNTIETETGIKALCEAHYAAVADHSREEYASEQAAHRHRARNLAYRPDS